MSGLNEGQEADCDLERGRQDKTAAVDLRSA